MNYQYWLRQLLYRRQLGQGNPMEAEVDLEELRSFRCAEIPAENDQWVFKDGQIVHVGLVTQSAGAFFSPLTEG